MLASSKLNWMAIVTTNCLLLNFVIKTLQNAQYRAQKSVQLHMVVCNSLKTLLIYTSTTIMCVPSLQYVDMSTFLNIYWCYTMSQYSHSNSVIQSADHIQ